MKCNLVYRRFIDGSVKFNHCSLNIASAAEFSLIEMALIEYRKNNNFISDDTIALCSSLINDLKGRSPHNYEKTYICD